MNTVGEIVRDREVFTSTSDQNVFEAVSYMVQKGIGAVAVLEGERVVGIFSERDLMKRVVTKELNPKEVQIKTVMTEAKDLITARPEETWEECMARMKQHQIRHLVIASGEQLIGVISLRDLMLIDIEEKAAEIKMMNAYLHYVPPES